MPPRVDWDDDAIPERFWLEDGSAAIQEPRLGREWARLVKAGEVKRDEEAEARLRESRAVRLAAAKQGLDAKNNASPYLVTPARLPPPSISSHVSSASRSPSLQSSRALLSA